jgi:hypothetical protein
MVIQPKLTLGAVGDKYEQEADQVAKQVMRQIHAPLSQPAAQSVPHTINDKVQRAQTIQPVPTTHGSTVDSGIESTINQTRGGGQPLADQIRAPMEQAFGADFSGVRVHTSAQSDRLNHSLQARAFTTGQDIFFRQGTYNPSSSGGQQLLAHELTHVVQQNGRAVQRTNFDKKESPVQRNIIQRDKVLYRGCSTERADATTLNNLAPTGSGEFGKGLYFWDDDFEAAVISAVAYNGNRTWSVIKITIPDNVYDQYVARELEFPSKMAEEYSEKPQIEMNMLDESGRNRIVERRTFVEGFRKLNQQAETAKDKAGLRIAGAENDKTTWGYDVIKGPSAADYSNPTLNQVKFEAMNVFTKNGARLEIVANGQPIHNYNKYKMAEKKQNVRKLVINNNLVFTKKYEYLRDKYKLSDSRS